MYFYMVLVTAIGSIATQEHSNYRLPRDVIPLHYKLDITTYLYDSKYQGQIWITIACRQASSVIKLHSKGLKIYSKKDNQKVCVSEKDKQTTLDIVEAAPYDETDQYIITLAKPLDKGKTYIVYLNFEGGLEMGGGGFFRASYEDTTGSTKWYAITDFKTGARNTFPCFDEPSFRAKFSISVGVKASFVPISNMPSTKTKEKGNTQSDIVWHHFQQTPPLSPHQVGVMVTQLNHREVRLPWSETSLHLWARESAMDRLDVAVSNPGKIASVVLRFVAFYKDFFSVECPLSAISLVSLPDSGHIPSFGIVIELEAVLLSDVSMRETNRLAHDVAALWLDGLVTIKWWSDLWYTWSLAEYLATLAMQHVYPNWNIVDRVLVSRMESIYGEDSEEATTVLMPIDVPEDIFGNYYNNIFYDKGPVLMRMVHLFLGDIVFKKGLNIYLLKFQHESASYSDLWECLTEAAHETLALPGGETMNQIMDHWITQTGFPIVNVTRDYQTGKVTVSQKRFTKDKLNGEENYTDNCWWVPLTYSTMRNPCFSDTLPKYWLNCRERELSFSVEASDNEWIVLNNRIAGLYRVSYDDLNWNLIAAALKKQDFSKIDVLNRVQLIIDAWDLAKIGSLAYETAFNIISYLEHEKEYLPWKVALARLKVIKEKLYRTPKYHVFKNFMKKLLKQVFGQFRNLEKNQDEEYKLQRRNIVKWACEFDVEECKKEAKELFLLWKDSHKSLPKDIRRTILCKGVEDGNWEFLQKYYKTIHDFNERKQILYALSCTTNVDLLTRYLEWSISKDSGLPAQFCFDAFQKVVKNDIGYSIAWDFMFNNFNRIKSYSPRKDLHGMYVQALAEHIVTDKELGKLKDVIEKNKDELDITEDEIQDAFTAADERVNWLKDNYDPIIEAIWEISF